MLLVIGFGAALLFRSDANADRQLLLGGYVFSNQELTELRGALAKAGIDDYQVDSGRRVLVPREREPIYVAALVDADAMPKRAGHHFDRLAQQKRSPFDSARHHDMRLRLAIQGELAHVISEFPGVDYATVLIDETKRAGFRRQSEFTASVAVMPLPNQELDLGQARSIQEFVASSVGGLQSDRVSVINMGSGTAFPASDSDDAEAKLESRIRLLEQEWTSKFRRVLAHIPGVKVVTSAGINVENENFSEQLAAWPADPLTDDSVPSHLAGFEDAGTATEVGATVQDMRESIAADGESDARTPPNHKTQSSTLR